ncbi:hypothetical protein [Polyangium jinanense]|uniref:Lipoprotein n=1 Tax=Polyangium jinanense TaxID=2829994 RepID=A0A9X3XCG4_9BACT|nr:hypothetical protein [Polyangium jinanense]MDC3961548.1 hypothetical protein [Polyangium jinanense]MDC3987912.1 hypothetical protein [Polyangium jinanense]
MKRWLFVVIALACLWGCSDEASQNTSTSSSASSGSGGGSSSSGSSGSGGGGGTGGEQPTALVPCLDEPDALPRPPSGKLPCEYVPPGLSLPQ